MSKGSGVKGGQGRTPVEKSWLRPCLFTGRVDGNTAREHGYYVPALRGIVATKFYRPLCGPGIAVGPLCACVLAITAR